jgi:mannosyltransferase
MVGLKFWGARLSLGLLFGAILLFEATGIGTPGMWWDEASTISAATRDWPSFLSLINLIDAVHALYYVGMHFWIQLFGLSPFSLRLPSAIAVTAGCWFTYLLGKRLSGTTVGVLAAVMLAILPRASWAATEARSYGFSLALAAASSLAFVIASQATAAGMGDRVAVKKWRMYRYAAIASNYVFLYSLLVTISHGVSLFVTGPAKRQEFKAWLRSFWIVCLSSLPILIYGSIQNGQIGWIDWKLSNIADLWFKQNFLHNETFAEFGWSVLLLALLVQW